MNEPYQYTFDLKEFDLDTVEIQKHDDIETSKAFKFKSREEPVIDLDPMDAIYKDYE